MASSPASPEFPEDPKNLPSIASGKPPSKKEGGGYSAENITVLEGLAAVRLRPAMYIGSTGERGLHHLVYEVVDNAVDEALGGHADTITCTLLADGGGRAADNRRGIPRRRGRPRRRQRPRHPGRQAPDREAARGRGRHDDPARRRQVRRQVL